MSKDDIDTPVDEKLLRGEDEAEIEKTEIEKEEEAAEEEAAEEAAEEIASEKESDKEVKDKPGFVTQERFNQVYAELKQLKEQGALKATTETVEADKPIDIKALRKKSNEAFFDGDLEKHAEIQEKIDAEILRKAEETAERKYAARQAETSFTQKALEMTEKYPVLRDGTGNQDAIDMVVNMRDAYIAKGMSPAQALETAANKVAPLFNKAEPAAATKETVTDMRTLKAVERGVKTNETIPPQTTGVGNRAQTISEAGEISQEDWNKLSPAEREKRLAA